MGWGHLLFVKTTSTDIGDVMRATQKFRRSERGAAAVEFAIILPVLFLILGGIVDLGRAMYTQIQLTNAAREGARAAIGGADLGVITSRAQNSAPGIADMDVDAAACAGTGSITTVTTSTTFDWILLGPAMSVIGGNLDKPTLQNEAEMAC